MPKFVPRERKHKVLSRHKIESNDGHGKESSFAGDSNAVELLSRTTEKEQRRQEMRLTLRAQQSKPSAKKQKRLDKYIVCSFCMLVFIL
jgi:hypothetical protein